MDSAFALVDVLLDSARAFLDRPPEQGRLEVPILQLGGGAPKQRAIEQSKARPARLGIDPLESVVDTGFGERQQRRRVSGGEATDLAIVRDQAVGEDQQTVIAVHGFRGIVGAAG